MVTADVTLPIASNTQSIEVTDVGVTLDTTTTQIESSFTTKETQDIPVDSAPGGVLNLSLLTAGVTSSGGSGQGNGPAVGGQRPRNNNFTIEGLDNNNLSSTGQLVSVPNDAVASFSLLQDQFSAEYGHSSGGQFNTIVLSGTNSFHGRAYEYFQNRNLNAIDTLVALQTPAGKSPSNPRYDNNRFGGQIGGPIIKNKLFFFGNFEYNPVGNAAVPAGTVEAPTAAGYATLATIPGVNQTNVAVLKQFEPLASASDGLATCTAKTPHSCVNGVPVDEGLISLIAPSYTNTKAGVGSIDYDIGTNDQFRGRYIYNGVNSINAGAQLPAFAFQVPTKYHLVTMSEYHTFSPNLYNEIRAGYNHYATITNPTQANFPGLTAFPKISIAETNLEMGPTASPGSTFQGLYSLVENLGWVRGNHNFKFGVEGRKWIAGSSSETRIYGEYDYLTLSRYVLDLPPDSLGERTVNGIYSSNQNAVYWYANDSWRLRSNLTANLGVRYEFNGEPSGDKLEALNIAASVPGLISFANPHPQYRDYAPRIGIAYSPGKSGRTSIRAGFNIAYDIRADGPDSQGLPPQVAADCRVGNALSSTCIYTNGAGFLANGGIQQPLPLGFSTPIQPLLPRKPALLFRLPATIRWSNHTLNRGPSA